MAGTVIGSGGSSFGGSGGGYHSVRRTNGNNVLGISDSVVFQTSEVRTSGNLYVADGDSLTIEMYMYGALAHTCVIDRVLCDLRVFSADAGLYIVCVDQNNNDVATKYVRYQDTGQSGAVINPMLINVSGNGLGSNFISITRLDSTGGCTYSLIGAHNPSPTVGLNTMSGSTCTFRVDPGRSRTPLDMTLTTGNSYYVEVVVSHNSSSYHSEDTYAGRLFLSNGTRLGHWNRGVGGSVSGTIDNWSCGLN